MLTSRFTDAFALAWDVHGEQIRKGTGIPYMSHLMAVCALALENGADEDVAIAALLHDAVEDSRDGDATLSEIATRFGPRVARIVLSCSDAVAKPGEPKPAWRERKEAYLRHLESESDEDALLVSLCDKVHNARAILADLQTDGDAVWERFTVKDPAAQTWYYRSLVEIFTRRRPGPLSGELTRVVDAIAARMIVG